MNRRNSVWTPAISAIATALCIGVLGFILVRQLRAAAESQPPSQSAQPQPSVDVIHPRRDNLAHRLTANATLDAFDQTDLYAKVSGYLTEVNVDIGDHVKDGQLLAVVALPETEKELAEAKAQLQAKQKQLKAAEAGVVQAQKLVEIAQRQLDHFKADLALQQITLKRQEELFQGKAATNQTVDDIRAKAEIAKADVGVAEAKIAGAQADVSGAEANRDFAAAQVDVAAAAVGRIQTLLEYTRIVAPYPGVVTRRLVNKGDLVQAATASRTTPMFTVQRIDTIRVFCDIPENDVPHVRVGDPANIKPYGFDGKGFDGKVTRFAFWLNPETRNMRTEIDLPNSDERLYPGMYAEVSLDTDRRQNVLTIPTSAVASDSKGKFVYTIQDGRVARLPVKVGLIDGTRIEITDGVTEDAQVVTTAKGAPPPGTAVHATAQP